MQKKVITQNNQEEKSEDLALNADQTMIGGDTVDFNEVDIFVTLADEKIAPDRICAQELVCNIGCKAINLKDGTSSVATLSERRRYDIRQKLGMGSQGSIYRAYDNNLDRDVAIKVLRSNPSGSSSSRTIAGIAYGAKITAKLEHPGVVPINDLDLTDDGLIYYSMRKIEGVPLSDLIMQAIEDGNNTPAAIATVNDKINITLRLCDTIAYAHNKDIIHRDIKPDNIMIGSYGEVHLVDWGLACEIGSEPSGNLCGTPIYMSPEQARREELDQRSDIYNLGATLYYLLLLRKPLETKCNVDFWNQKRAGVFLDMTAQDRREIPYRIFSIVKKAMAPNLRDRYQSASELAADLRRYQQGQAITAHQDSILDFFARVYKRHRAVIWILVLAVTATFGALEIQVQSNRRELNERVNGYLAAGASALESSDQTADPNIREEQLIEAQYQFAQAQFLDSERRDVLPCLVDAYTRHFELAIRNKNWRQAREKLLLAVGAGLIPDRYHEMEKRLLVEQSQRANYIKNRITFLMDDARKGAEREMLHQQAVEEMISLSDPITVDILREYLDDPNADCRIMARRALGWMDSPSVIDPD